MPQMGRGHHPVLGKKFKLRLHSTCEVRSVFGLNTLVKINQWDSPVFDTNKHMHGFASASARRLCLRSALLLTTKQIYLSPRWKETIYPPARAP